MIKTVLVVSFTAMTSALGGQLIASDAGDAKAGIAGERSFMTPRIDGRRLDIRFSADTPADPAITAASFCEAKGFASLVGYSLQPVLATRKIGDLSDEFRPAGSLRAFYAIRCAADAEPTVTASL